MASVRFSLSEKTDVNGTSQVLASLTISRTNRPRLKTGVYAKREWFKDGEVVIPRRGRFNFVEIREAERVKAQLSDFAARVTHICNLLGDEAGKESVESALEATKDKPMAEITRQSLAQSREDKRQDGLTGEFFADYETYVRSKSLGYEQTKGYHVLMRAMWRYQSFIRHTDKKRRDFVWEVDKATPEDVEGFFDYIRNEKTLSEEYPSIFAEFPTSYPDVMKPKKKSSVGERGENTMRKMKKRLKAFYNWLNKQGYSNNRPFRDMEIGSEHYGTPYYLTLEERNKVADFDLSDDPKLAVQRDIFVFQCLVGCRVSDLYGMRQESVIDGSVQYIPRKTKDNRPVTVTVPLNARAKALVEKYKGVDTKGRLFPFLAQQRYNEDIKQVMKRCGITRVVTVINPTTGVEEQRSIAEIASSHMARRTFIGNLYKQVKDPNLIGVLSGHTEGSKAFARYRDIDDDIKRQTISLID